MQETTKRFLQCMDSEQIKYEAKEREEKDWVGVKYNGNNINTISIQFFFDLGGKDVALRVFTIAKVPQNKTADMLKTLNELMVEYRWLRFYLDADNEVTASYDATITAETAAPVAKELMFRTLNIVDECYPRIMQTLWA